MVVELNRFLLFFDLGGFASGSIIKQFKGMDPSGFKYIINNSKIKYEKLILTSFLPTFSVYHSFSWDNEGWFLIVLWLEITPHMSGGSECLVSPTCSHSIFFTIVL